MFSFSRLGLVVIRFRLGTHDRQFMVNGGSLAILLRIWQMRRKISEPQSYPQVELLPRLTVRAATSTKRRMKRALAIAMSCGLLCPVSCGKKPAAEPPLSPVSVAAAKAENVPLTINTFGNCVSVADVTLQAQVNGTLLRYAIAEGATAKKGDLVAEIDPGPYQAALQQAQGALDSAKAQLPTRRSLSNASRSFTRPRRSISPTCKLPKPINSRRREPLRTLRVNLPPPKSI